MNCKTTIVWKKSALVFAFAFGVASYLMPALAETHHEHVTDTRTYATVLTLGGSRAEIWHIEPGAFIDAKNYIDIAPMTSAGHSPTELWLEGGSISANMLILRKSFSAYYQTAGNLYLWGDRGIIMDGGTIEMSGGLCEAEITFRKCTNSTFTMSGGRIVAQSVGGDDMGSLAMIFAACDEYAVYGDVHAATAYAITSEEPITQAPKSITVTGTPVSGCVYALVSGLAGDAFFSSASITVPDGWSLVRRQNKLLLVETATLAVATATWTGAANDGNPRTPGNWECRDASGNVVAGVLPGVDAMAYVPAGVDDFEFPSDHAIALDEVRFLGNNYSLKDDADWSGLGTAFVTKFPSTIDANGHALKLSALQTSVRLADLTEPGGSIHATYLGTSSVVGENTPEKLIDGKADSTSRFLVQNFEGCSIDYDFGAGHGKVVRGIRLHSTQNKDYMRQRRPKEIFIYGTQTDPSLATDGDWTELGSYINLDIRQGAWSDYLVFDNATPYRAYRVKITKNYERDFGSYLELYEMEFVEMPTVVVVNEVTSSVAGGELQLDVSAGTTVNNAMTTLSGQLKLVKEGEGMFVATKAGQTYLGGTDVECGVLATPGGCDKNQIGLTSYTAKNQYLGALGSAIKVDEGGEVRLSGNYDYYVYHIILNGGALRSSLVDDIRCVQEENPAGMAGLGWLTLTADSTIYLRNEILFSGKDDTPIDLGGHVLTIDGYMWDKHVYWKKDVVNGTLNLLSDGTVDFVVGRPVDARTVTLIDEMGLTMSAEMSVSNYTSVVESYNGFSTGTELLRVYGTFTPVTDYFYGCTLQNGATIDLSAKEGPWSVQSALPAGRNSVSFENGASVAVELGDRELTSDRGYIISWTTETRPSNYSNLKFTRAGTNKRFASCSDGVCRIEGLTVFIR